MRCLTAVSVAIYFFFNCIRTVDRTGEAFFAARVPALALEPTWRRRFWMALWGRLISPRFAIYLTRFKRGLARRAAGLALRVEDARMAPAAFLETPCC